MKNTGRLHIFNTMKYRMQFRKLSCWQFDEEKLEGLAIPSAISGDEKI